MKTNLLVVLLKMRICQTKNQLKNYTNQLFKKIEKRELHTPFIDNIWGVDLADIRFTSQFDK